MQVDVYKIDGTLSGEKVELELLKASSRLTSALSINAMHPDDLCLLFSEL